MANLLQMARQVTQGRASDARPSFDDMVSMAKAAGSPQAAMAQIAQSGMKVTMPNGQKVGIQEFSQMMQGKTPQQAAKELGIDQGVLGR